MSRLSSQPALGEGEGLRWELGEPRASMLAEGEGWFARGGITPANLCVPQNTMKDWCAFAGVSACLFPRGPVGVAALGLYGSTAVCGVPAWELLLVCASSLRRTSDQGRLFADGAEASRTYRLRGTGRSSLGGSSGHPCPPLCLHHHRCLCVGTNPRLPLFPWGWGSCGQCPSPGSASGGQRAPVCDTVSVPPCPLSGRWVTSRLLPWRCWGAVSKCGTRCWWD